MDSAWWLIALPVVMVGPFIIGFLLVERSLDKMYKNEDKKK